MSIKLGNPWFYFVVVLAPIVLDADVLSKDGTGTSKLKSGTGLMDGNCAAVCVFRRVRRLLGWGRDQPDPPFGIKILAQLGTSSS